MKFDELKATCDVVDEADFSPLPPTFGPPMGFRPSLPLTQRGPVKCKSPGCEYWPWKPEWMTDGYCTLCRKNRADRERDFSNVFSSVETPGTCMRCDNQFADLHSSGYCMQCRVIIEEMGLNQAAGISPEKTTTRVLSRLPQDATRRGPKYGTYYCMMCERFMAKELGKRCADCEPNGAGPLLTFRCGLCYQQKSYIMGGTCAECRDKLIEASKGGKKDVDPSEPQIVVYTPTREGGWMETRKPIPMAACQRGVTPSDAGLGAVEDC